MDQLNQLLTPQELSAYLGIPVATLYAWRYHGHGPTSFKVGKHLRYRRSDVALWIIQRIEVAVVPESEVVPTPPEGGAGE